IGVAGQSHLASPRYDGPDRVRRRASRGRDDRDRTHSLPPTALRRRGRSMAPETTKRPPGGERNVLAVPVGFEPKSETLSTRAGPPSSQCFTGLLGLDGVRW